jgi:hypothetical protein
LPLIIYGTSGLNDRKKNWQIRNAPNSLDSLLLDTFNGFLRKFIEKSLSDIKRVSF